jgi:hypothetical protein
MYVPFACLFPFIFLSMLLTVGLNTVSRLAMQTVRKVHTLGITQNLPLELHHFVMKDNNVLLINFSRAVAHQCNAVPICGDQRVCLDEEDELEVDCSELMAVAKENLRAVSSIEDCAILMP